MDARCRSPIDVSAALDILGRLSISEDSEWNVYDFPAKGSDQLMPDPYAFGKRSIVILRSFVLADC